MNGDIGKIFKVVNEIKVEVATIKTTQELQHLENCKNINAIKDELKLKASDKDVARLYKWFWAITIGIILVVIRIAITKAV